MDRDFEQENINAPLEIKQRHYRGSSVLFKIHLRAFLSCMVGKTGFLCIKIQKESEKEKTLHLCVWLYTSAMPDAFETLSFLTRRFNSILPCNLFLAYFNALENCVASFQLIRVIPKWLLASMKIGV